MGSLSQLSQWYFSKKAMPYWVILCFDTILVFISALFVFTLNNGFYFTVVHFGQVCATISIYLIAYIIGFRLFHTYSGIIRYSSFIDLQKVTMAMCIGIILSLVIRFILGFSYYFITIRLRDIILWSVLATGLQWGFRVLVKFMHDTLYSKKSAQKIFIYGIRQGGISIAKSIRNQDPAKYVIGGFVSDDHNVDGRYMMGVKVYPNDKNLPIVMKEHEAFALFVSPLRSESLRNNTEMVNDLIENGIKIFMVPSEQEWDGHSDINAQQLREVQIEDLLPREKIEVDMDSIGKLIKGRRILITGAAGSIGSEIVKQVAIYQPEKLMLIDQAETPLHDIRLLMAKNYFDIPAETIVSDISNKNKMEHIFKEFKPEYVFHAAAYKHVPMMENNPSESIINNVEGTRILADLAVKYGAKKFVMVSTDKAVNPTNVMGCSKRICEIYVQSLDKCIKEGKIKGITQFVTTRFGNVLGSNGSVIPIFKEQIKNGGPITVTHPEIIRYFMLIPEACKLVLEAGTMGNGGEIFVFDMGKPVKIVDLAKKMIKLSGANIEIKFTGLRDGEKLYEEVLNEKETTLPTVHPKIMVAKVREYDYFIVKEQLKVLAAKAEKEDDMEIVRMMKLIVPEFKSQHSVYEILDKDIEKKC